MASYCDDCACQHVCGEEGVGDPALKFCAYHVDIAQTGTWKEVEGTDHKLYFECSVCQHRIDASRADLNNRYFYCDKCGAEMVMVLTLPKGLVNDVD